MQFKLLKKDIVACNATIKHDFPKYSTQIMNLANQNAGGTRPRVVGQLSDLFQEFQNSGEKVTLENWRKWYLAKYPNTIDEAVDKIMTQVENLKNVLPLVDRNMVKEWVDDLVIDKTFCGLYYQKAILEAVAKEKGVANNYRLATPDEEAQGIDGYIDDIPYSVKPVSYGTMDRLPEVIDCKMIFYEKDQDGNLHVDVND